MKSVLVFLSVLLSMGAANSVFAQAATVPDWTKTDCDGVEHNLYAELDSGSVVIMDFAMTFMGGNTVCPPCSTASAALERIKAHYDSTNLGKVHHYAMSYSDSYDCDNMNRWKEQCGFVDPCFPQCEADVKASYGSAGMPLIIVVGPNHTMLKKITSWSASGSPTNEASVRSAIDKGLAEQSLAVKLPVTMNEQIQLRMSGSNQFELNVRQPESLTIEVFDVLGKVCATLAENIVFPSGQSLLRLPALTKGPYLARVCSKDHQVISFPFSVVQ